MIVIEGLLFLPYNGNCIEKLEVKQIGEDWLMDQQNKKCLIAYFSHAGMNYASGKIVDLPVGNTQRAAEMICRFTGGDLFHIRTAAVYPYDYQEVVKIAKKEKADNARPALEKDIANLDDYDVIFLGYPNWCGTMPMVLWTFLENHDFSGKTIYPFCTHEGSGVGHSLEDIHALCPQVKLGKSLALLGTTIEDAEDDIRRWIRDVADA